MREREIEQTLVKEVASMGGWCLKWTSPSMAGIPDRIILLPEGKIAFVEVKAPGQQPRKIQVKRIQQLKDLGFLCCVLDDVKDIPRLLEEVSGYAI